MATEAVEARSVVDRIRDRDDEDGDHHWNPVELVSIWWKNQFAHHNQFSTEKVQKADPFRDTHITLHYDTDKRKTVAVLSGKPTEALSVHFSCRIAQGTAVQRSILYYELDGFVRENFTRLRKQHFIAPDSISIAMGSLEASDEWHQRELEKAKRDQASRNRGTGPFIQLCEVMEVVREHWLNDDLDALSIYSLSQVNRDMNSIAKRIATYRLRNLSLTVTPFVDGAPVTGYSTFNRGSNNSQLVQHKESGRSVEYRQCETIPLVHSNKESFATFVPVDDVDPRFEWGCEELALGNLRWWFGGIEDVEYVGQKLVVSSVLHPADAERDDGKPAVLSSVRFEVNPRPGKREWPHGFVNLSAEITNGDMRQLDQISIAYAGKGRVVSVSVNFLSLVRIVARRRLKKLRAEMDDIRQTRPLLSHEHAYLRFVNEAATTL